MSQPWQDPATARAELADPRGAGRLARAFDTGDAAHVTTWLALAPADRRTVLTAGARAMHERVYTLAADPGRDLPARLTLLADLVAVPKLEPHTAGRYLADTMYKTGWRPGVTAEWATACAEAFLPYGPEYPKIFHDTARVRFLCGDHDGVVEAVAAGRQHGGSIWLIRDDTFLAAMWADDRYAAVFADLDPPGPVFDSLPTAVLAGRHVRVVRHSGRLPDAPDGVDRLVNLERISLPGDDAGPLLPGLVALPKLAEINLNSWYQPLQLAAEDLDPVLTAPRTIALRVTDGTSDDVSFAQTRSLRAGFEAAGTATAGRLLQITLLFSLPDRRHVTGASVADLLDALDCPVPVVRGRAVQVLADVLAASPPTLAAGDEVLVAGRLGMGAAEMAERLGRLGVKVGRKPGPATRAVVVGERHRGVAGQLLAAGLPVMTEAQLAALLERTTEPVDTGATDRIRDLFASPDPANPALAAELVRTNGLGAGLLAELLVVSRCNWLDQRVRDQARRLFNRNAPVGSQAAVRERETRFVVEPRRERKHAWQLREKYFDLRWAAGKLGELSGGELDPLTLVMFAYRMVGETELTFGWPGMTELPAAAFSLPDTVLLDAGGEGASMVADEIGDLTRLRVLDLAHNTLTVLPDTLGKLSSLETLRIGANRLTELPASMAALTGLTELSLGGNPLTTFPGVILRMTGLTTLRFEIGDKGEPFDGLPPGIGELTALRHLDLSGQHVGTLPESMRALTELEELNLRWARVDALPEWLGELPNLQKVWLDFMKGTDTATVTPVVERLRAREITVLSD